LIDVQLDFVNNDSCSAGFCAVAMLLTV